MEYLSINWEGLQWTPWIHFDEPRMAFKALPTTGGIYRVRPAGADHLAYIGQTGRSLRERLSSLRRHTLSPEMPFNDPHTAAPSLWALRHAEHVNFECSAAPVDMPKRKREGLECYLLWKYRTERCESTLCNHGRFHRLYQKSGPRSSQRRGGLLTDGQLNRAGDPSIPPLIYQGRPFEVEWMGLQWSALKTLVLQELIKLPQVPGVYKVLVIGSEELLYVGQTMDLKSRLLTHSRAGWGGSDAIFSFSSFPKLILAHQLKEIENDLIGGFYNLTKDVPRFQFFAKSPRQ